MNPCRFFSFLCAFLALGTLPAIGADEDSGPRPITAAEEKAASLALLYLAEGPAAWVPLADEKRLPGITKEHLETAAGPPDGAVWRLLTASEDGVASFAVEHPSGWSEILTLTLDPAASRPLVGLEVASQGRGPARSADEQDEDREASGSEASPGERNLRAWTVILGIAAAILWLLSYLDRRWVGFLRLGAAAAALAGLGIFFGIVPVGGPAGGSSPLDQGSEGQGDRPSDLAALRRALAMGDAGAIRRAVGRLEAPDAHPAVLWRAQAALLDNDLQAAEQLLAEAGPSPFSALLRARLGAARMDVIGSSLAYEQVLDAPASHGPWILEAAEAFQAFDFEKRADRAGKTLESQGSRRADTYYHLARRAVVEGLTGRAARHFQRAWTLEPMPRDELLDDYLLAYLLAGSRELRRQVSFGTFDDVTVPCEGRSVRPLLLPEGAEALLVGGLLAVEVGNARLEIPAGCVLAPASARETDAATFRRRLDRRVIETFSSAEAGGKSAELGRARLERVLEPLAREQRWEKVISVASAVEAEDEAAGRPADPEVLRRHATALERLGRSEAAAGKLIDLARSNREQQRFDPATLLQLGEILVQKQEYDRALAMIKTALDAVPFETSGNRLLQIEVEKRLFRSSKEHLTDHFRLVYPPSRTFLFARRAAEILEKERVRLERFVPQPADAERVDVLLLDLGDFFSSYAGQQILGLYDGRIRVPLGEVQRFDPFVVSLMTHELAHAMIAAATRDRAPHWLHEGLAQHLEMPQDSINPFPDLEREHSRLALPLIESALKARAAPSWVQTGYDQARWTVHYLESRFGTRGIHRLLEAFEQGATTEEALRQALGVDPRELDRELRRWGLEQAPKTWPSRVIDYDPESSGLISR